VQVDLVIPPGGEGQADRVAEALHLLRRVLTQSRHEARDFPG
jgi:hypothetical protein